MASDDVVTCFLRNRGAVLLVRRSEDVGPHTGRWGGISGPVEAQADGPLEDARREIREKTGIEDAPLVRAGDRLDASDAEGDRPVHPFLFESPTREVTRNDGLSDHEWVSPPSMLDRETVPGLWEAYRRVAPVVDDVREDDAHGSAWISLRALEILRDEAAVADDWASIVATARDLRDARPTMAAVENRVNRAMSTVVESAADGGERTPEAVRVAAERVLESALDADDGAAETAAETLIAAGVARNGRGSEDGVESEDENGGGEVATLSRSGTVVAALRRAAPSVLVGESRPAGEGVDVAEELAASGLDVTLATDAALAALLAARDVGAVLVGADAVLADGSVVNKTGTRALALAAAREGVPLYAAAARDKVRSDETVYGESGAPGDVYDGDGGLTVENPLFDRTPPDLVAGVATEDGRLDAAAVREVADEHAELARWDDDAAVEADGA